MLGPPPKKESLQFFFITIVAGTDFVKVMLILEGATPLGSSARALRAFRMIRSLDVRSFTAVVGKTQWMGISLAQRKGMT